MYEKICAVILTAGSILAIIWFVCGRHFNRWGSRGAGQEARQLRGGIKRAGDRNSDIEAAERRTADVVREQAAAVGRAEQRNRKAKQDLEEARNILRSAKHTSRDI